MPSPAEYEAQVAALGWDDLRTLWEAISRRDTPGWEPGRAFEYLVLRAFELDGADVRWPYQVSVLETRVEQIDGAIHFGGYSAIVESKDLEGDVSVEPIAKMRNQLLRRPSGVVGMIFSRSGFTAPAKLLAQFLSPQTILLWRGEEVGFALSSRKLRGPFEAKYRYCVEHGLPDYNTIPRSTP